MHCGRIAAYGNNETSLKAALVIRKDFSAK